MIENSWPKRQDNTWSPIQPEIFRMYRVIPKSAIPPDFLPHINKKFNLDKVSFYKTRIVTKDRCFYDKITCAKPANGKLTKGRATLWRITGKFDPWMSFESYQRKLVEEGWKPLELTYVGSQNKPKKAIVEKPEFTLDGYLANQKKDKEAALKNPPLPPPPVELPVKREVSTLCKIVLERGSQKRNYQKDWDTYFPPPSPDTPEVLEEPEKTKRYIPRSERKPR